MIQKGWPLLCLPPNVDKGDNGIPVTDKVDM